MKPLLSIITPSFNQAQYLEQTILSVVEQDYKNVQFIIIDGGSTDASVEIIRKHEKHISFWVSEKDRGQAHALNKGLAHATGELVAYINSDDLYLPGAFTAVIRSFAEHPECNWLCGDTILFGEQQQETKFSAAKVPESAAHALSWAYKAPQPGMFWKRALLINGFAEQWRYCFDHELYVRLLLAGERCYHLAVPLAAYRLHPSSKTVAEGELFDDEFDQIAEIYTPQLKGSARRWAAATGLMRQSAKASRAGRRRLAANNLLHSLLIYPESVAARNFWGCLRQVVRPPLTGTDKAELRSKIS